MTVEKLLLERLYCRESSPFNEMCANLVSCVLFRDVTHCETGNILSLWKLTRKGSCHHCRECSDWVVVVENLLRSTKIVKIRFIGLAAFRRCVTGGRKSVHQPKMHQPNVVVSIFDQEQEINKLLSIAQNSSNTRQSAAGAREERAPTNLVVLPPPVKFQRKGRGCSTTCAGPLKSLQVEGCLKSSSFETTCNAEALELLIDTTRLDVDELVAVNTSMACLFTTKANNQ